jgi:signal transduction histidine kinase/CheY-like chemotaxis protein
VDIAPVVTLVSYAVLFVQWAAVMWLYARFRREARDHDVVVSTLFAVLAVDAAKNLFESGYFGAMWLSHYAFVPTAFGDSTMAPLVPKALHIAVATFVLARLAGDFLPRELRERRRRRVEEERLRLEQEHSLALVKESEGRLQSLLERTTDIVCFWRVIDNDIVLESINSAGRAILGLGDDAVGTPAQLLVPDGLLVLLEGALATGEPVREEEGWLETGGGRRAVIRQVVPLPDPDGVIRRMTSFTHDVTALRQRQADEEARTRLESLGILAGGVAHDFNNLLAVLRADVEAASAATDSREHLVHAQLTIDRARDLVAQLLAMAGKRAPVTSAVDFGDVVDETVRLLRPGAPRGLVLETEIAPDIVVVGDRPQLQQVVLNLIHNAIDAVFSAKNATPTVRVSLSAVEGEAVLVVSDNGPGIEPAVQRRIFEPFFSTKRSGRGLGLATVFGLTQAHSGRVVIDSVVGAGATFTVRLPRTNARPQPVPRPSGKFSPPSLLPVEVEPAATVPPVALPASLSVLLIDDDDRVRRATRRLLERLGHTVIDVDGGEAGLAVSEHYDLAVVDVTMPGMDGPTSLARLRERRPGLPAVLVTGRGDLSDDGDIVLTKPFDADELKAAIATALSSRRRSA